MLKEAKLVNQLIKGSLMLDKKYRPSALYNLNQYKSYNIDVVKEEFEKQGYRLTEPKDAPDNLPIIEKYKKDTWVAWKIDF